MFASLGHYAATNRLIFAHRGAIWWWWHWSRPHSDSGPFPMALPLHVWTSIVLLATVQPPPPSFLLCRPETRQINPVYFTLHWIEHPLFEISEFNLILTRQVSRHPETAVWCLWGMHSHFQESVKKHLLVWKLFLKFGAEVNCGLNEKHWWWCTASQLTESVLNLSAQSISKCLQTLSE